MIYQLSVPAKAGHIGNDPSTAKFGRDDACNACRLAQFRYQNIATAKVVSIKFDCLMLRNEDKVVVVEFIRANILNSGNWYSETDIL